MFFQKHLTRTLMHLWLTDLSSTGNTRLPVLFERNAREVSDSHKLPSSSLALPPHWRTTQPPLTKRGWAQPLGGTFCSRPYGRLIDGTTSLCGNRFLLWQPLIFLPSSFSYCVKWPLCIRDHWAWPGELNHPCIQCLFGWQGSQ